MHDFAREMSFPTSLSDEEVEEFNAPDKLAYFGVEDDDSPDCFDDIQVKTCPFCSGVGDVEELLSSCPVCSGTGYLD